MQGLWAWVLAGEVNQPSSFSLRTVETLSQMTQNEAKLFLEIVGVAMQTIEGMWFVLGEGPSSFNLDEVQDLIISNNKIWRMQECGLLNPIKDNMLVWYNIEKISSPIRISDSFALMNRTTLLLFHSSERGKTRVQKKIDKEKVTFFPYYPLTETGRQLLSIV